MREAKSLNSRQSDTTRIETMIKDLIISRSVATGETPSMSNIPPEKRMYFEQKFLRQLKYDGMALRQDSVEEAHKGTFRWIFETSHEQRGQWGNFQKWLDSPEQQLYWITGKPGAGKTTLMKLICDAINEVDPKGPRFDIGSENRSPTVASFFFWAAGGSEMQRSKEGLFRTLTHQLLSQHPELIATVSPDRWQELCLFGDDPTSFSEPELRKLLCKCVQALNDNRVWLFIDGLDEFSGKHDDLMQFLVELMNTCTVKVCLSSRPWEVFEEAFQNRPSLRIHELTHWDMKSFLLADLRRSQHFIALEEEELHETKAFVTRILEKAQGVFMWIKIVAGCIREALTAGESIQELHELLDNLPDTSLDDLFHRILQELEPRDLERAAKYIGFMKAHDGIERSGGSPMRAITVSFADEMDPEVSISLPVKVLQPPELHTRLSRIKRKVNSSCKGLLEFVDIPGIDKDAMTVYVQYPHRSVKDYLDSPRAQAILSRATVESPHLRLCAAYLVLAKTQSSHSNKDKNLVNLSRPGTSLGLSTLNCVKHAAMVSAQHSSTIISVMYHLRILLLPHHVAKALEWESRFINYYPISSSPFHSKRTRSNGVSLWFLSIAVLYQVFEYVKHDIMRMGHLPQQIRPSLWKNRVRRIYQSKSTWLSELDILLNIAVRARRPLADMIELLLRSGANPNFMPHSQKGTIFASDLVVSPWEWVLSSLIFHFSDGGGNASSQQLWPPIGRLMVVYGAKVDRQSIANALRSLKTQGYTCFLRDGEGRLIETIKEFLLGLVVKGTTEGPLNVVIKYWLDNTRVHK